LQPMLLGWWLTFACCLFLAAGLGDHQSLWWTHWLSSTVTEGEGRKKPASLLPQNPLQPGMSSLPAELQWFQLPEGPSTRTPLSESLENLHLAPRRVSGGLTCTECWVQADDPRPQRNLSKRSPSTK
ncbi:hypothetical protein H1C71_019040, partial [Ictidomys tridecemlineatus]